MTPVRVIEVTAPARRLDIFLAAALGCSRAAVRRLCDAHQVRVDGKIARLGQSLVAGQKVQLAALPPTDDALHPSAQAELPLDVVLSDEAMLALAKPAGQPSQPLRAGETGTLANALVARYPECADAGEDPREGGLVQRLDSETSGVILAARSRADWTALRGQFSGGAAKKSYLAIVTGDPPAVGEIDAPIGHSRNHRRALAGWAVAGSRPAVTHYRVLARAAGMALVAADSHSGRLHQIRVHLAHVGHPLVGDTLYGGPPWPAPHSGTHLLHALRVEVPHPRTGTIVTASAPLPAAFAARIAALFGDVRGVDALP